MMAWEIGLKIDAMCAISEQDFNSDGTRRHSSKALFAIKSENKPIPAELQPELPREVFVPDSVKALDDWIGGRWRYISPRFKSSLCKYAGGDYEFFPVTVKKEGSGQLMQSEPYYICHSVCTGHNILDQIDFDKSDLTWVPPPGLPPGIPRSPTAPDRYLWRTGLRRLAFSREKIIGMHFWTANTPEGILLGEFMSDEMMLKLKPITGIYQAHHNEI